MPPKIRPVGASFGHRRPYSLLTVTRPLRNGYQREGSHAPNQGESPDHILIIAGHEPDVCSRAAAGRRGFPRRSASRAFDRTSSGPQSPRWAADGRRTPPRGSDPWRRSRGSGVGRLLASAAIAWALWTRSPERIAPVAALKGIDLTMPDSMSVRAPIAKATCDMGSALAGVRLVLVAVPASAHADVAQACAPYLRDGQIVLLLPGRTGGALEFGRVLRAAGCRARILLGEANTFPLAARCVGPAQAVVFGTKDNVQAAAVPSARTSEFLAAWRPLLPMLSPARSVLHTGLANVGAVLHPVIALYNADRIALGDSVRFLCREGVTSVRRLRPGRWPMLKPPAHRPCLQARRCAQFLTGSRPPMATVPAPCRSWPSNLA